MPSLVVQSRRTFLDLPAGQYVAASARVSLLDVAEQRLDATLRHIELAVPARFDEGRARRREAVR